ncbi:hypothetical protein SOV_10560 [Sporomusa ovata DSM 2662]|nr:hypothetical protein SOV_1c03940 [Sporomusa ovata DSM 2662]
MNEVGRYGGPQESAAYRMVCRGTNHWVKAERNNSDRRKIEVFGEGQIGCRVAWRYRRRMSN